MLDIWIHFEREKKKKIKTLEEREKWNWDVGFTLDQNTIGI